MSGEARGANERVRANERRNKDGVRDKLEVTRRYYTCRDSLYLYSREKERGCAQKKPRREREEGIERDGKWDTAGAVERRQTLIEVAATK